MFFCNQWMDAYLYRVANNRPLLSLNPVLFGDLMSTLFTFQPPLPTHRQRLWEKQIFLLEMFRHSQVVNLQPVGGSQERRAFPRGQGPRASLSL